LIGRTRHHAQLGALALCAAAGLSLLCTAGDVTSPNGSVQFVLDVSGDGQLLYQVRQDNQVRLKPARAGVIVEGDDLSAGVAIGQPQIHRLSEVFPWRGAKNRGTNACQVALFPIHTRAGRTWILEARVFDDGVGFRYRVPGEGPRQVGGEPTTWLLPEDATLWYQTDTANYEGAYHSSRADAVPLEESVRDRKRPTHIGLPLTAVFADGTFGLINEAALYRYSGVTLRPQGQARFQAAFQDDPKGWSERGEIVSPWRVIVLSKDLNGLVNSDVIPALCPPPDPALFPNGVNTAWLQPGKAPCTWMVFGNDGAQWDRQKWFVDRCAASGCEYLLVDAGWRSEKWGWLKDGGDLWGRTAELCRYAAERNVGIVLWHAFPEGRDDGPGLTTEGAREDLFAHCKQAGVKGVKIDFFDSESRAVIGAYEDLLQRSARHQLLINFHGANKPTGEARTWPNEITREGIREQEYVLWGTLPLEHYGALPFTRMAAGHADFLPGYIQPRFLKNTTLIFQMAAVVVFTSPFLCWPDNPDAYLNSPLLEFVRTVPVTWDETRVLPGSVIGETVLITRRKDNDWYIAALNCRAESRRLEIDLAPFGLADRELTLYRDGPSGATCEIQSGLNAAENARIAVTLRPGGGCLARLRPPRDFAGWK
jgi:alpha-glucosidase